MASPLQLQAASSSFCSLCSVRKSVIARVPNHGAHSAVSSFSFPFLHPKTLTLSPNLKILKTAAAARADAASFQPSLKSRLKNGEALYGIFLLSFSPTIAEIAGLAGYDFAVVDMEHGHGGISDALPCLHALAATNTAAILRLPESSAAWVKKALDLGPQGIMFPMIDDAKLAREAVSYCRFPPAGVRGSAHPLVRASDYGINAAYVSTYEENLLIMCQVESEAAVKNIDKIAAVDGVDCVQMGPLDLSASMGYLWDPGHKKVRAAIDAAEKSVLSSGKAYLSGFVMPHDGASALRRRGYHMVSGAADIGLFRNAAVEDVRKFKECVQEVPERKPTEEEYWSE